MVFGILAAGLFWFALPSFGMLVKKVRMTCKVQGVLSI